MIKNICGIIFSIGVIGFTIYYINNNVKEGWQTIKGKAEKYILKLNNDNNEVEYIKKIDLEILKKSFPSEGFDKINSNINPEDLIYSNNNIARRKERTISERSTVKGMEWVMEEKKVYKNEIYDGIMIKQEEAKKISNDKKIFFLIDKNKNKNNKLTRDTPYISIDKYDSIENIMLKSEKSENLAENISTSSTIPTTPTQKWESFLNKMKNLGFINNDNKIYYGGSDRWKKDQDIISNYYTYYKASKYNEKIDAIIKSKGNNDYIYINKNVGSKLTDKWENYINELKENINYRNKLWDYIKTVKNGGYNFLYKDDDDKIYNHFIEDTWSENLDNDQTQFIIDGVKYNNNENDKNKILKKYEKKIIDENTTVTWAFGNGKIYTRKLNAYIRSGLYNYIKNEVKKKLDEGNGIYYYIIQDKPYSILTGKNYNIEYDTVDLKEKIIKFDTKQYFYFVKSPYKNMTQIEYDYLFKKGNSKWDDYRNSITSANKWIIEYAGENTQDENIKKLWRDIFIDDPREKNWMYNIEGMKTIEGMETIHDIEHPYYGAYYDISGRNECLDTKVEGNEGECNTTKIKNGKICKFIPSLWGFKEKNICLPINCLDNYNPHKMCRGKYNSLSKIPNCNNNKDCSKNGTLTYSLNNIDRSDKQKYKKQYYVNGKSTNKDTTENGICKCMCKPDFYGDTCDKIKKQIDNICSNDVECKSGNCVKENERDINGLCKKSSFETKKEKNDKIEEENMKKTSFLNIMLGLILFVFVLLIISYFFYSIKKNAKKLDQQIYGWIVNTKKK